MGVLPTSVNQRAPPWLDYERTPAQHGHNLRARKYDSGAYGQLRGDAVLVGEPAENLLSADPSGQRLKTGSPEALRPGSGSPPWFARPARPGCWTEIPVGEQDHSRVPAGQQSCGVAELAAETDSVVRAGKRYRQRTRVRAHQAPRCRPADKAVEATPLRPQRNPPAPTRAPRCPSPKVTAGWPPFLSERAPNADSVLVERIDSLYRGGPITIIPAQKLTPARKDCGP